MKIKINSPPIVNYTNINNLQVEDYLIYLLQLNLYEECIYTLNTYDIDINFLNSLKVNIFSWCCYNKYLDIIDNYLLKSFSMFHVQDSNKKICIDYIDTSEKKFYELMLKILKSKNPKLKENIDIIVNTEDIIIQKFEYNLNSNFIDSGSYGGVVIIKNIKTEKNYILKLYKKCQENLISTDTCKEIIILTKLNKFNYTTGIVDFYGVFNFKNCFYLILEELNYTLDYICNKLFNYLTISDLKIFYFKIFSQILNAVNSIHSIGYIHSDLKFENIMLDKNNNIKLIDFGISEFIGINNKIDYICTYYVNAPDSLIKNNKNMIINGIEKKITINKPNYCSDIYSIGSIFLMIILNFYKYDKNKLYIINNKIYYEKYDCNDRNNYIKDTYILNNFEFNDIKSIELFKINNIFDLICKMMDLNSKTRIQTIDEINNELNNVIDNKKINNDEKIFNIYSVDKIILGSKIKYISNLNYYLDLSDSLDFKIHLILLIRKYPQFQYECIYVTLLFFEIYCPKEIKSKIFNDPINLNTILMDINNFKIISILSIIEYYNTIYNIDNLLQIITDDILNICMNYEFIEIKINNYILNIIKNI